MPRPKTAVHYERLIGIHAEDGLKPPAIVRELAKMHRPAHWDPPPKLRTVATIYSTHMSLPPAVRDELKLFRWPETFELGLLPWEASQIALELLRYRDVEDAGRPTVGVIKWFWRVTLAAPDLGVADRSEIAVNLATEEWARLTGRLDDKRPVDGFEWYLAYHRWRSDEDRKSYKTALTREVNPLPSPIPTLTERDDIFIEYVKNTGWRKTADRLARGLQERANARPSVETEPGREVETNAESSESRNSVHLHPTRSPEGVITRKEDSND